MEKNRHLRCFVANFFADGFTVLVLIFWAKSALVLIFTLFACPVQVQVHLGYALVYLDLDLGYLSGVGQVHLPLLWYLYYNANESQEMVGFIKEYL